MINNFQKLKNEFQNLYSEAELQHIFYAIAGKITGFSRAKLLANKNTNFSVEQNQIFDTFIKKMKSGAPLQYVLGEAWFYGLRFNVNSSVLIPRPETEELVELIINENQNYERLKIIDIGTGSGCIAITLKKWLNNTEITATDISDAALATARQNALENNADINFINADITCGQPKNLFWDIIVSNPPYVTDAEKDQMESGVVDFEPHTALFVENDDSLYFYRKIAEFAREYLAENGKMYFEINKNYGENCVRMLEDMYFKNTVLLKDISGNNRMIITEK